jgi:hypothetical protein
MSQKDRILRLLEERGDRGVHSFEFYEMRMPRGAAAIHALKKEGHPIEAEHQTYKGESEGVRYFLRSDQLVGASVSTRGPSSSSAFDPFGEWS